MSDLRSWLMDRISDGRLRIAVLFEVMISLVPVIGETNPFQLVESGRDPSTKEVDDLIRWVEGVDAAFWDGLPLPTTTPVHTLIRAVIKTIRAEGWRGCPDDGTSEPAAEEIRGFLDSLESSLRSGEETMGTNDDVLNN